MVLDDAKVFNEKLREWERLYNFEPPHTDLGGQTPRPNPRELVHRYEGSTIACKGKEEPK